MDNNVNITAEAMKMAYAFTIKIVFLLSIIFGIITYTIIVNNSEKEIYIDTIQQDNNNSTQEVNNGNAKS